MRLTLLVVLALGGCATTPALFGSASPSETYATVKQSRAIADCLEDTFGPVSLVRRGNRASITSRDARPKLSLRIYDNGTVQVWRPTPLEGQTRSSVESCI